jgi:hypothetical protein
MKPHTRLDPDLALLALLVLVVGLELIIHSRRVAQLDEQRRIDHNMRAELEEQLETRRVQLDGALEKITELKGDDGAAGE